MKSSFVFLSYTKKDRKNACTVLLPSFMLFCF